MKRNPCKVKWIKAYRMSRGKDMTKDATFEFERKSNRPERDDRNLAENTLRAFKKIDKVRVSREAMHHANRMKVKKPKDIREYRRVLEQDINLVKSPSSIQMDPSVKVLVVGKVWFRFEPFGIPYQKGEELSIVDKELYHTH